MALTTVARLSLEGKGFQTLFTDQRVHWTEMVERARELMVTHVPGGNPTIDDVKRVLLPLVELDGHYLAHVNNHHPRPLTQRHWAGDFTDYILHRVLVEPPPD